MLNPRLLNYLKELDLEPLWLRKGNNISPIITPKNQKELKPKTIKKSSTPNSQFIVQEKSSDNSIPHTLTETNSTESINELEVNTRAQFILADKDGDFMLIGFMAPSLNQIQNPLKESTYSRLLNQLFKQLNLTFPDDYLIKKQELNQYISKYKIQAILLFSREFNATQLLTELSQKNAPIKILEHPNNLIRNPLLKKELWLQLHQFFKNLN